MVVSVVAQPHRLFLCAGCIFNHEIHKSVENVDPEKTNAKSHHTMMVIFIELTGN